MNAADDTRETREANDAHEGRGRRDVFGDAAAWVDRIFEDARPYARRALDRLESEIDAVDEAVRPAWHAAMDRVRPPFEEAVDRTRPTIDRAAARVEPELDSILGRLQEALGRLRRWLADRAERSAAASQEAGRGPEDDATA